MERDFILKQWLNKGKQNTWMPYMLILGLVLLLEIFVFNFSTWKTLGNKPVVLASDVVTDEKGQYTTGFVDVSQGIENVDVSLDVIRYDRAEVIVSLTDAGDYYAYDLPVYTVVPQVRDSGYQNIYSFGKVHTIQITVNVPEGTEAHIEEISCNVVRPFSFKLLRVLLLFGVFAFGHAFFSQSEAMKVPCMRKNKKQRIVTAVLIFILVILAGILARTNPVCVNSLWPHHRQYQELAESLKNGSVVIGEMPDERLLAKDNPYDTSALLAENIPFKMDYALYDGNYYAYFGIVPEVLFYLPYYLLTGSHLQNYMVVFALYCGVILGVFGTLWEVAMRYVKKTAFAVYAVIATSICLLPHYIFMVARPDIYNVPVMAGNAFIWLGTFCWLKAVNVSDEQAESENAKSAVRGIAFWYGAGAFCMACIMGCRPQIILYAMALFFILLVPRIWKSRTEWKKCIPQISAFMLPFILVGGLVFWYNYARFGNGFDFGATYSLTSNDMNNRGFNFSRIVRGLYSFLFQPPVINATFPFLESCELESNYMGRNIVEFSYGGILFLCPMLCSLFYVLLGGFRTLGKEEKKMVGILSVVSLVVAAFDINAAGILQRYMSDMVFGLVLATVVIIFLLLERHQDTSVYRWMKKGIYLCTLIVICFAFLSVMTSADSTNLDNYNPILFYKVASYFKF